MMRIRLATLLLACTVFGAPAKAAEGKVVYAQTCQACHATGVANAPRFGDRAAWAARAATGLDVLVGSVLKGKGAMPPKGGNAKLAEAEVRAAVEYMLGAAK